MCVLNEEKNCTRTYSWLFTQLCLHFELVIDFTISCMLSSVLYSKSRFLFISDT